MPLEARTCISSAAAQTNKHPADEAAVAPEEGHVEELVQQEVLAAEEEDVQGADADVWPVPAPAAVNINDQPEEVWSKTVFIEGKGGSQVLQAGGYKFYKNGIKVRAGE